MIDLHSHILHGLDDGARTLDDALAMARVAVADGITLIAATPHCPDSIASRAYSVALVRERLRELRAALRDAQIALEVVEGTELCYAADLPRRLHAGELLAYGGAGAVLLECSGVEIPAALPEVIFGLQATGHRVVLAHPERLRDVQRRPALLAPLAERGALVQITAAALVGRHGEAQRAAAEALLRAGLAHIIASDAHSPALRPPVLSEARARAAALLGEPAADLLVRDIPRAVLDDAPIPSLPQPTRPSRRWRLW
jgi:protein-tyrosine phosphatase